MTLKSALKNKKIAEVRQIIKEMPIFDIAKLIEGLDINQRLLFFRVLKTSRSAEIFSQLDFEIQEELIQNFSDAESNSILEYLYADDIADLIEELPANISNKILANTPKEKRQEINKILKYSDEQTGSIMSTDIVDLKQS
jgi:magnesium transporter